MRPLTALFLFTLLGCGHWPAPGERSLRDIERMPFPEAYRLWRQERQAWARSRPAVLPTGATDPKTGRFRPSLFAALTCRLGREAPLHEAFLRRELTKEADVHQILEASPRLCRRSGIVSLAPVVWVPGQGYSLRATDGWVPQVRQRLWLAALNPKASKV